MNNMRELLLKQLITGTNRLIPLRPNQRQMAREAIQYPSVARVDLIPIEILGPVEIQRVLAAYQSTISAQPGLHKRLARDAQRFIELPVDVPVPRVARKSNREQVEQDVARLLSTPINPFVGLIGEAVVHVLSEQLSVLLIPIHHLECDEASHGVFVQCLSQAYGSASSVGDGYAGNNLGHQETTLGNQEPRGEDVEAYAARLRSPRPSMFSATGVRSGLARPVVQQLSSSDWQTMRASLLVGGVPPTCALVAAVAKSCAEVFDARDVRVGTALSNRWSAELSDVVGLFATFHVIRFRDAFNSSIGTMARHTTRDMLATGGMPAIPLPAVVEVLHQWGERPDRSSPIYEVSVAFGEASGAIARTGEIRFRVLRGAELPEASAPAYTPVHVEALDALDGSLQIYSYFDTGLIPEGQSRKWSEMVARNLAAIARGLE